MQFFYKRLEELEQAPPKEGEEPKPPTVLEFTDSLNTEFVIVTRELSEGRRLVILNDGHQESRYDKWPVVKGGKYAGEELRKEAAYYQSRIVLEKEDAYRFMKMHIIINEMINKTNDTTA
jgi:hypothetical protein